MDIILRLTLVIVLLITVAVLCSLLGLLWSMPDIPKTSSTNRLCIPMSDKAVLQCGQIPATLHTYLDTNIRKQYEELDAAEKRHNEEQKDRPVGLKQFMKTEHWIMKPAARFTGAYEKDVASYDENGLATVREWRNRRRLYDNGGFRRYGIKYIKGRIVVPVGGTYQVYSFLDLYEPCIAGEPDIANRTQPIKHAIFKYNVNDKAEKELISGVQPHQKSANMHFNIYSSYISSIVSLKAGDELTLKVSNITYLNYPDVNFFGVNLL